MKNSKNWYALLKDGTIKNKEVFNFKDKGLREEVILKHFSKFYEDVFGVTISNNILERNNPHDFTVGNNFNEAIPIEITSFSDEESGFKKQAVNLKINELLDKEGIDHNIIGLIPHGTSTGELKSLVSGLKTDNEFLTEEDDVINIIYDEARLKKGPVLKKFNIRDSKRLIITDGEDKVSLAEIISAAIRKKEEKEYKNVKDMILIIDDHSITYTRKEIEESQSVLVERHKTSLFKEIFIYSGQYSEDDGTSSKFTFYSVKVSDN